MGKTEKAKKIGLTTKIFIALIAGAIFGIILCYLVPSGHVRDDIIVEGILYVIGQGFIRLMKMWCRWYSVLWCVEAWPSGIRRNLAR